MTVTLDFPELFGWESIPAAAIFAVLYSPLFVVFLYKIIHERQRVLFTMTLFCLIRVAAFTLRAISIGVTSVGEDEGVFIATEVLFSVGFFGLLYSAYTLVLDRLELCDDNHPTSTIGDILHFARNRRLFRLALVVAMILGIVGIDMTSSNPTNSTGITLRKASAVVFLILTIVQVLQTTKTLEKPHVSLFFGVMALLLLVREVFTVATINDLSKANDEDLWYPLVALPEWLCAVIYTIPGLIPPKVDNPPDLPLYTQGYYQT
ncbi:hypothetical protein BDP27DRAFT_1424293 [Rhodocollybia butyracea]|uniref:DUF7702 domain-containing protein n=1 Tax=Rhodocollybia butyracea TaxID=206335 RepID=A0A9P5PLE7_9AGAR|nr:hypothetical protein BDP27DRAFT_1424293 [Rhodocollybia butyracea]